ncbi:MAG: pyridoxamine 5'-phosphate oxidase family protein [Defluviitaleaceae bacterium]|nr:pyridoxamine 5'-phosphate oxidase family protein [Defluviitaleaceae bacterium]
MEIIMKAEELVKSCNAFNLASVGENGYPRICVLSKTKADGIKKLYASTGMVSTKVKHFKANPKASACIWKGGDSITLIGTVKVTQDPAVLKENWLDWFTEHYTGIDDPNYCVLEFTTEEAVLWVGGEFATVGGDEL